MSKYWKAAPQKVSIPYLLVSPSSDINVPFIVSSYRWGDEVSYCLDFRQHGEERVGCCHNSLSRKVRIIDLRKQFSHILGSC